MPRSRLVYAADRLPKSLLLVLKSEDRVRADGRDRKRQRGCNNIAGPDAHLPKLSATSSLILLSRRRSVPRWWRVLQRTNLIHEISLKIWTIEIASLTGASIHTPRLSGFASLVL